MNISKVTQLRIREKMTWELTENVALECCFATTFLFVGSLYVWTHEKRHDRDEPETIKKRLFSVFIACILSTILIRYYWNGSNLVKNEKLFHYFIIFIISFLYFIFFFFLLGIS